MALVCSRIDALRMRSAGPAGRRRGSPARHGTTRAHRLAANAFPCEERRRAGSWRPAGSAVAPVATQLQREEAAQRTNHHGASLSRQGGQREGSDGSESARRRELAIGIVAVGNAIAFAVVAPLAAPHAAQAAQALTPQFEDVFNSWLDYVESLGALGPLAFVATVTLAELVPLVPTQPLALASGILFGALPGAAFNLLGVTAAASAAFLLSRTVGRPFAQWVISEEMGKEEMTGSSAKGGAPGRGGFVRARLAAVKRAIEGGSWAQQLGAVVFLRLTPVVPFSMSNYVLGLTPMPFALFCGGTVAGMAVWSLTFASLGTVGRSLILSGMDFQSALAEVSSEAAGVTEKGLLATLAVGAVVGLFVASPLRALLPQTPGAPAEEAGAATNGAERNGADVQSTDAEGPEEARPGGEVGGREGKDVVGTEGRGR